MQTKQCLEYLFPDLHSLSLSFEDLRREDRFLDALRRDDTVTVNEMLLGLDRNYLMTSSLVLESVAAKGDLELLKVFVNSTDVEKFGWVLLRGAVKGEQREIIKYLLDDLKIDIHTRDDLALFAACFDGKLEMVEYLITTAGAHINSKWHLLSAAQESHVDVVVYLLEHGAFYDPTWTSVPCKIHNFIQNFISENTLIKPCAI